MALGESLSEACFFFYAGQYNNNGENLSYSKYWGNLFFISNEFIDFLEFIWVFSIFLRFHKKNQDYNRENVI